MGEIGLEVLGSVPTTSVSPQVGVRGQQAMLAGPGAPHTWGISAPNALVSILTQKSGLWAAFRELPSASKLQGSAYPQLGSPQIHS